MSEEFKWKDVEAALLQSDGSCRDINFSEFISIEGAVGVLDFLASSWKFSQATSGTGDAVPFEGLANTLGRNVGSLATIWEEGQNPSHIQAFFSWGTVGRIFCELTFFPCDFDRTSFTLDGFLATLDKLVTAADSEEYYIRFENVSWRHNESGIDAALILSHQIRHLMQDR